MGVADRVRQTQSSFPPREPMAIEGCPPRENPPVEAEQPAPLVIESKVAPPKKAESPKTEKKTWVEFIVVDKEGEPVPGVRYRVKLPDGTMQEGVLDAYGQANFYEIDPGTCKITFPDLDQDAVEEA